MAPPTENRIFLLHKPIRSIHIAIVFAVVLTALVVNPTAADEASSSPVADSFILMLSGDKEQREKAFAFLEDAWQDNFTPMVLESVYLSKNSMTRVSLMQLLQQKSRQEWGYDLDKWYLWMWQQSWNPHPDYAAFKSKTYQMIDPKFAGYFSPERKAAIRLNEVRWGGVRQDGIPPLRSPAMIPAEKAGYLQDNNIVFGLEVNGDVRAYPKRILAWHEMFTDTVGKIPVAGVYCTLCGTMILYKTSLNGNTYNLGTSGFLYRSNKLMYDKKTQSLWSTLLGSPVIGPLVGKDIALERLSVVTTTWGEWRRRHPQTLVLSLNTGHQRDYQEGAAYRQYFATDELMFEVPEKDTRLRNKAEVLGLIFQHAPDMPLAISSSYLRDNPLYMGEISGHRFVVLTDTSGAHRVYEAKSFTFSEWDQNKAVTDSRGIQWILSESALTAGDGSSLYRQPSHNSFWFGWYSAFRHTRLIR